MGAFSHNFLIAPSDETTDWMNKVRGCTNSTDLLYHHANYGEDCVLYTGCRRTSVSFVCYRQVCLQGSKAASIAFTRWSKMGFSPLRTQCCNKGKIWHGEAVPRAKFHLYRGRNVGRQSLKLSKFQILPTNLPCRSDSFAQFLWNSQHLYTSTGSF